MDRLLRLEKACAERRPTNLNASKNRGGVTLYS
jgi:hypothetical protein